jgi:hypothetical protein
VLPLTQPVRHRRKGNRLPPVDSLGLVLPPLAEAANHAGDAAAGEHGSASVRPMNAAASIASKLPSGALSAFKSPPRDFDTTRAPDGPVTRKQARGCARAVPALYPRRAPSGSRLAPFALSSEWSHPLSGLCLFESRAFIHMHMCM